MQDSDGLVIHVIKGLTEAFTYGGNGVCTGDNSFLEFFMNSLCNRCCF